jgi:hypothetical protein
MNDRTLEHSSRPSSGSRRRCSTRLAVAAIGAALGACGTMSSAAFARTNAGAEARHAVAEPSTFLIGEYLIPRGRSLVILPETASRFGKLLSLTPNEQSTVDAIVAHAERQIQVVVNTHDRARRRGEPFGKVRDLRNKLRSDIGVVERAMVADLRAIAGPERAGAFEAFERWRRQALRGLRTSPEILERSNAVAMLKLFDDALSTPGVDPSLASTLDRHARDTDAQLMALAKAKRDFEQLMLSNEEEEEDTAQRKLETIMTNVDRVSREIARLDLRALKATVRSLPEGERAPFVRRSLRLASWVYVAPAWYVVVPEAVCVREVRALTLSTEQTAQIDALVANAQTQIDAVQLALFDKFVNMQIEDTDDGHFPRLDASEIEGRASTIMTKLETDLRKVLTPEQIKALEASPVLSDDRDDPRREREPDEETP